MLTIKQLCCMGVLCLALLSSSCTKEDGLWSELPTTHVLLSENESNLTTETSNETTENGETIFVMDGGVEINETQLEWVLPPIDDCRYTHEATVERQDCGWILKLDDNRTRFFALEGAESFEFEENLRVKFAFQPVQWTEHKCMSLWVNAIEVFCMDRVE